MAITVSAGHAVAAAFLVPALSATAACSDSADERTSTPSAPTSPAVEAPLPCVAGVETVPPTAGATPEEAMAAYCVVADLVRAHGFTDAVRPGRATRRDLAAVRPLLTPQGRQRWDADVAAWLEREDLRAGGRLDALVLHDVTAVPRGYVLDAPWIHGTEVGEPSVREAPGGGLELRVPSTSGVVLARRDDDSGRHSVLPVTRDATYVLVPDGDGWLVDEWAAEISYGEPRLVSG